MKKPKLFLFFILLCGFSQFISYAESAQQPIQIKGEIIDAEGAPLPGVNIVIQGTMLGTVTDIDGKFTLSVPNENTVLVVSFIGYETQTIAVASQRTLKITLRESSTELEEVVVVAYGAQKKVSVTGAISTVQTKELKQSSAANLSTALAGRLPGLTALQMSGQPGNDVVNLYLRGRGTTNGYDPLIMIDGVPRDNISTLDPNEIASVSILKDASATAVFGVRGANGVILITTRRGSVGKTELSVTADYSLQQFIANLERTHSWEFAELRNQAARNDGVAEDKLPFTPYMIDMYKSGADRVFYPDRDPYREAFCNWSPQTRINVNLNGGTEDLQYFMNVGYVGQGGQFKTESKDDLGYDPSYKMDRYSFRANVDYNITKGLKLTLNLASYLEKMNSPQTHDLFSDDLNLMVSNMIGMVWSTAPIEPGPLTVGGYTTADGVEVPANQVIEQYAQGRNNYGEVNRRGYRQETKTLLNSSLALDWSLDFITPGLSTKAMLAFDTKARTTLQGVRSYNCYSYVVDPLDHEKSTYRVLSDKEDESIRLYKVMQSYYYMNFQYSLNYSRKFFDRHDVGAMVLFQRDNWERSNYMPDLPYNLFGLVGRATYGYDNRYLAEFNIGYNGSEQFAPDNRFGLFPAVSLGWVASNEAFLKDNHILTNLKLRFSYGKVGNDKMGESRFLYLSTIREDAGGWINSLGYGKHITQGLMGNEHIQWEVAKKQNYGLDFQLFKELSFSADVFFEKRDHILISRGTVPELQGVALTNIPKMNMGKVDNQGYEMELTYQKIVNQDFSFTVRGNYAYNRNKQIAMDEAMFADDYTYRYRKTGYSIGQSFGYLIDYSNGNGYINTQEELDNLPKYNVGGVPRLGDFKYVDTNNDGEISAKDMVPLGYTEIPRISYSFSGNLTYQNLDFSFLLTGIAQTSRGYPGWGSVETAGQGMYFGWHKHAWTQERYENGEEILYPALSMASGASHKTNSHFMFNRSFVRLKNVELGYSLPQNWIKPIGMSRVRVYVNGNNLLTWHHYPIDTIDPEQTSSLIYPVTRMVNFGLNVVF